MNTVALHWLTDGPAGAPTLVLLGSVGSSTEMWAPCVGPLAEQFRVVRIDARGHGGSPASPPGTPCSLADLGRDLLAVLDRLGAARVHLAGLSLGGMTGMWLAVHHPERVARLVLLCSSAHLPPAQGWADRAATVRAEGMGAIADAVLGRWTTPALAARDPELVTRLRAMLTGTDPESYAQCCEAIGAMDLRADLGRIAAPTLVIGGAQDPATPPEHQRVIAAGIPGARLELLDPAAHLVTVALPGAVAALLLDHLGARDTLATGFATRRAVLGGDHVDAAVAGTTGFTAPFQELVTRYAWGDVWSRPGLARRDRSVATLAALVALGAEHELAMHVRAALRNGLTPAEIREVLLHTAVYAGMPRANRAFAVARQVIDEQPG
jgi:3-oxoadipate enol-lactonase/4-carboxymuconolactone decarboxylase